MTAKGTSSRYGSLGIAIHWISALLILAMLLLGFLAGNAQSDAARAAILRWHVPIGVIVLLLTLARIAWWRFDTRPDNPPGTPRWQIGAAHTVHVLLYAIILLMASSGIALMVLSGAAKVLFFGGDASLPRFGEYPPMAAHFLGALTLIALLCFHVGAAAYHQFYRRDRLLARMGIGRAGYTALTSRLPPYQG